MSEWTETNLGEVVEFFDHKRIPLNSRQRAVRKGPFPYYGASGVFDYVDNYIFDGRYLLIAEDGENLNSRKLPLAFFAKGKFWVNNHAHIIRGIADKADDEFLKHWFAGADISGYITGAAQPKLSQGNLRSIKINLPSFPTQRKIASILSAYDDLIENNTRRVKILEEMARMVYREWFVSFRFPGHDGRDVPVARLNAETPQRGVSTKTCFVDSPLGQIPEGWEVGRLQDYVELCYGKALKAEDRLDGQFPVYGSSGVVGFHSEHLVDSPGVIVGRKGNVGSVRWTDEPFFPIDTVYYVKTDVSLYYVFYNLQQQNFINNDAAVPGLNRNQAYSLPFVLPSELQLKAFDEFIGPVFKAVRSLTKKNQNLRQTRDLLLPKLISGEVAV